MRKALLPSGTARVEYLQDPSDSEDSGLKNMRHFWTWVLLGCTLGLGSGCRTYQYRLTQPATAAQVITRQTVTVRYEPLEYQFSRDHERLAVRIVNPTEDRIGLRPDRSYVVDPRGESHPLHGRVIGPHSFTFMRLPPEPVSGQVMAPFGPGLGWGPGFYGYGYGPYAYYGGFYGGYYGPSVATYQVITPYDWNWGTGPARLRLTYDRNGKAFEHEFEFIREPQR